MVFDLPGDNILPADTDLCDETSSQAEAIIDWDATAPLATHTVEPETQDEAVYTRKNVKRSPFPIKDGLKPGHAYRLGRTVFQSIRDDQIIKNCGVLGPFKDEAEWELAKWLVKNVGHAQVDTLLKLSIVSQSHCRSIPN